MTDPATDPEIAGSNCPDGDVERFIGPIADTDDLEVAVDAFFAEHEADLDGDGLPDPAEEG